MNVQQTSLDAHNDYLGSPFHKIERDMLLDLYKRAGPMSDHTAAILLQWNEDNIRARRNEMKDRIKWNGEYETAFDGHRHTRRMIWAIQCPQPDPNDIVPGIIALPNGEVV